MITGYGDKQTAKFAAGARVRAFTGLERAARLKLDRLESAVALTDLSALPAIVSRRSRVTDGANTASASTIGGESVLHGSKANRARPMLKLSTITERGRMSLPAIHPGEQLHEELETLNMSAAELARQINVPANRITQILNGEREITADTAMRLGHFFGTSPQFWMNLQSLYELRIAQSQNGRAIQSLPTLKATHIHG